MAEQTKNRSLTSRPLRSFVRRTGRMTRAQARALDELFGELGVAYAPAPLDFTELFGRDAPRTMEIGFGNGELLVRRAAQHPERDFLGVEVHDPGVGHCLLLARAAGISNLRLIHHDAIEVLREQIRDAALDQVQLLFPDPWPKKRHHKRRLVQPGFVQLVARKLAAGGEFLVATDWAPYAEQIEQVVTGSCAFRRSDGTPSGRPKTRFEHRGERLGHPIWERSYRRV